MLYEVTNIKYDTDGQKVKLPKSMKIEVDDNLTDLEKVEFISDEISNRTGYCHLGFNTIPKINE